MNAPRKLRTEQRAYLRWQRARSPLRLAPIQATRKPPRNWILRFLAWLDRATAWMERMDDKAWPVYACAAILLYMGGIYLAATILRAWIFGVYP